VRALIARFHVPVALALAVILVLPNLHLLFRPAHEDFAGPGVPNLARGLARTELDGPDVRSLRSANPEWDLMQRTFTTLALANLALREGSDHDMYVARIDRMLDATVRDVELGGPEYFLLPYAHARPWALSGGASLFVDAEIALVLGARLAVAPDPTRAAELERRALGLVALMRAGPVLSAESYPNQCWTFDNATALAALAVARHVLGHDVAGSQGLGEAWIAMAKAKLVDPATGLLVSSYTTEGRVQDGPEGSSIFLVAHALQLVDPTFAEDQWTRARALLGVRVLGFAFAREWPRGVGTEDVDSGPTVPLVGANAGASGMMLVGAGAFGDEALLGELVTSLRFAAFPSEDARGVRFAASNPVGDAVLLYALTQGPLWRLVGRRVAS
jgi:hypothetical protein